MGEHTDNETSIALKALVFQMHVAGFSQGAIETFVGKSKTDINRMLKPLRKNAKD